MEDFKVNSKLLPENFPREFDAHIYFSLEEKEEAKNFRDQMREIFKGRTFFVGDLIPKKVGPHPMPMFEANFPREIFSEVVLWLMENRRGFSILVHPLTGDDYTDHTKGVMWLGNSIELNLNKL